MVRYRVTVNRVIRDCQWRTVEVEAADGRAAEEAALAIANGDSDGTFWAEASTHPLESEEAVVDDLPEEIG